MRAWIAQLDRQVRTRTAIGAALGLLALAAGGAGILLALDTKDEAATTADLNEVRTKITEVEQSVLRTASQDLAGFRMRLDDLTGLIRSRRAADKRSRAELRAARNEIDDLRSQISDLRSRLADLETEVATKADEEPQGSR